MSQTMKCERCGADSPLVGINGVFVCVKCIDAQMFSTLAPLKAGMAVLRGKP